MTTTSTAIEASLHRPVEWFSAICHVLTSLLLTMIYATIRKSAEPFPQVLCSLERGLAFALTSRPKLIHLVKKFTNWR